MQGARSNRAFTAKPVPEETLDRILEAAHRAPTASNLQRVAFTLVTDPENCTRSARLPSAYSLRFSENSKTPLLKPVLKRIAPQPYATACRI
ncbi:MAG: nitroreductase family protein [Alistipes sp.]